MALRAAGAGLKVYIGQFIKDGSDSENKILKKIKNIKIEHFGRGCFIKGVPAKKDIELAQNGLERIRQIFSCGKYDLVILDEINIAVKLRLLSSNEVKKLIKIKPGQVELTFTGCFAPEEILRTGDLITEMKEIKHYYRQGVKARRGIEY